MPPRLLTPNQIVSYNLYRARRLLGLTQNQAAELLEPHLGVRWSKVSWSAAERSVDHADRIKKFDVDELVSIASAFRLPVSFFLQPPTGVDLVIGTHGSDRELTPAQLIELAGAEPDAQIEQVVEQRIYDEQQAALKDARATLARFNEEARATLVPPSIQPTKKRKK
jgi:hypothetical protein